MGQQAFDGHSEDSKAARFSSITYYRRGRNPSFFNCRLRSCSCERGSHGSQFTLPFQVPGPWSCDIALSNAMCCCESCALPFRVTSCSAGPQWSLRFVETDKMSSVWPGTPCPSLFCTMWALTPGTADGAVFQPDLGWYFLHVGQELCVSRLSGIMLAISTQTERPHVRLHATGRNYTVAVSSKWSRRGRRPGAAASGTTSALTGAVFYGNLCEDAFVPPVRLAIYANSPYSDIPTTGFRRIDTAAEVAMIEGGCNVNLHITALLPSYMYVFAPSTSAPCQARSCTCIWILDEYCQIANQISNLKRLGKIWTLEISSPPRQSVHA
ncbi:hypothetical protein B0H15DRAFT_183858 [Mycena belliarum]|uniref:Uncharacterized protein n=1 Tax=Mycena belliarum TaxID=1033014 RepID=A0AAD6U5R2_9AGAR|nr:hypothetical protein B0H15DRAFT_183858 [Mycena belliae]